MKRISKIVIAVFIAPIFSMCNNTEKKGTAVSVSTNIGSNDSLMPTTANDSAKFVSRQVEVKGDVENILNLTVDSLKQMKTATVNDFNVVCQSGATGKVDKTFTGVLLKDILWKAGLKQMNHKDRNFFIVARATDNYKATFSLAEIFNNPTGENTYVIFEENGMPIKNQGDMILVCTNDIKTGPRHVIWLKSIEVNRVN